MAELEITTEFDESYYGGSAVGAAVPDKFDVALGGVGFFIDTEYLADYRHRSTPLLRRQGDASAELGESSVNPESLWPRSRSTWHLGADPMLTDVSLDQRRGRFRASKGVDVWTENQAGLLHAVDQKHATVATNLKMVVAGTRIYWLDDTALKFEDVLTDDTWAPTTVTGTAGTLLDLATDGYNVWVTSGADVYVTNTGITTASVYSTEDVDVLGWAKGRLWGAEDNELFWTSGGAFQTGYYSHATSTWRWVGFAEGPNAVYAAGYAGDKSLIYRIGILADASGPDQPIVAGKLPDGELVRCLGEYLGVIFIGTSKGWRYAQPDGSGNLRISTLVDTPAAVDCFEGQDRFVWFGYTNYDGTSSGLGRADVSVFGSIERQQLAYASDLMATAQGAVPAVVTVGDRRYFSVNGVGIFGETDDLVASGYVDSGPLTYDLADAKVALGLDVTYKPDFAGTVTWALDEDEAGVFDTVGTSTVASLLTSFALNERAARFEVRFTLTRAGGDATTGPIVTGWTLKAQPAPAITPQIALPLRIWQHMTEHGTDEYIASPAETVAALKALNRSREVLVLQEGPDAHLVILDDYEWRPEKRCDPPSKGWNGCFLAVCKELS